MQDSTELVLLSLVIFFSSDMLDLAERSLVEESQLSFGILLQKYISIRYRRQIINISKPKRLVKDPRDPGRPRKLHAQCSVQRVGSGLLINICVSFNKA